ncbi:MAG: type IV pilus biogenesis protein PilP [Alphaproteobacteria bacterium]|nr:type IV pilus biogenesis protein PilP [Alphaproteobacteria bacterium]
MQNKILVALIGLCVVLSGARAADDIVIDEVVVDDIEQVSADAIADYQVEGSLFQQITDLEQEKVLMQLEKERAQLDLELDRLAAEKIKLHMEIDTLSGRAEQQQQQIETEKAKLEAEAARLEREKEKLLAAEEKPESYSESYSQKEEEKTETDLSKKYKLVNVIGAGAQLQATITDVASGQTKRVGVGKNLDGYTVKSISLDEGIVFVKDGTTQTLNVGAAK